MKTVISIAIAALVLSACSAPRFSDPELSGLQTACSQGDMSACSELGHRAKVQ